MTALPELEQYIRALRNAFHRIDGEWTLPDELKDQRKLIVLGDVVAQLCGVWDAGTLEEIYRVAFDDGLDRAKVIAVVDGACERAKVAVEYRESTPAPKPKRPRPPVLPKATMDAIDWLLKFSPGELAQFLERHEDAELKLIEEYVEQKQKGRSS